MRRLSSLFVVGAMTTLALSPTPVRAEAEAVEVHDDYFFSQRIYVDPGDTVRWSLIGSGHTVTADDGSFDFPANAPSGGTLSQGDQVQYTFSERGVFYYHCRIHGRTGAYPQGMTGAVYVGVPLEDPMGEVRHVPSGFPTIASALHGIPPGSTILLAPGTYTEAVQLEPQVKLRGEGASPGDVVLDGAGSDAPAGIVMMGNGEEVENLAVRNFREGVSLGGSRFAVRNVDIAGGAYGVESVGGGAGVLSQVHITGADIAGIAIRYCDTCGTLIEAGEIEASKIGVLVDTATGVVVRDMTLIDDDVGVSVTSASGVDVTGLHVSGGSEAIKVATSAVPSMNVRVFGNEVTGYSQAGLAWDLLGARVCFSGNTDPAAASGDPTTSPPLLQTLFPC
jgi:plastocyanin